MKNVYLLGDDSTKLLSVHEMQDSIHYKQHTGNCYVEGKGFLNASGSGTWKHARPVDDRGELK